MDWVWVREGAGLRRCGQRVVLSLIQGDVQSVLRLVWVLCHVSFSIFAMHIKEIYTLKLFNRMWHRAKSDTKCSWLMKTSFPSCTPAWPRLSGGAALFPPWELWIFPLTLIKFSSNSKSHPVTDLSHVAYCESNLFASLLVLIQNDRYLKTHFNESMTSFFLILAKNCMIIIKRPLGII